MITWYYEYLLGTAAGKLRILGNIPIWCRDQTINAKCVCKTYHLSPIQ